jgi:hypothetical protein
MANKKESFTKAFSIFFLLFLLSFFVYSFESESYQKQKRYEGILIEALMDTSASEATYIGTFEIHGTKSELEITKELYNMFHSEGQKPIETYVDVSPFTANLEKSTLHTLSEQTIGFSFCFSIVSLLLVFIYRKK